MLGTYSPFCSRSRSYPQRTRQIACGRVQKARLWKTKRNAEPRGRFGPEDRAAARRLWFTFSLITNETRALIGASVARKKDEPRASLRACVSANRRNQRGSLRMRACATACVHSRSHGLSFATTTAIRLRNMRTREYFRVYAHKIHV